MVYGTSKLKLFIIYISSQVMLVLLQFTEFHFYFLDTLMSFCGTSICSNGDCGLVGIFNNSTCINHIVVFSISALLSILLLLSFILRINNKNVPVRRLSRFSSPLDLFSITTNGVLALVYLGLGAYMLTVNLTDMSLSYYPPHWWLTPLSQGVYMLILCSVFTTRFKIPKIWYILPTLFAGFICFSSIIHLLKSKIVAVHACLNILSLPGALLILVIGLKQPRYEDGVIDGNLHVPFNVDTYTISMDSESNVTPLSTAGFFSMMSFRCLNPLLRRGYMKPLEDKDIPELGAVDQAGTQYADFIDKFNNSMQKSKRSAPPSILWAIVSCQKRDILVSGLFALLKILTLSLCPLIINAFIKVYLGQEAFNYETHVLAFSLFFAKCLESLSQRQWYFRTRRLGLRVRSLLSAAIYKKQLRLSSMAKMTHSSGEIMNYVTVDAYRIGEFPYWFHQTWTTSLQLCIALAILYNSVGLATISSMVTIILTVACNAPLANLQHHFQIQLMEAQDKRLKAMSESLGNMKVLKLYAWERNFREVIENLRQKEFNWIKAFQLRKGYNTLLFWSSPVLVSAATFLSCYLMGVPLDPSNVFTFIATVRLVQEPVRQIPDVIGAVIQAKVAFARISKFLSAPELQNEHRSMTFVSFDKAIVMESCSFSWDDNLSRPNLRNVSLEINIGEKVAICGEVGCGKSTVLAALLGEVPKTCGMVWVSCTFLFLFLFLSHN
jgi:ATP-binding cassette, subfamily C (CFTR/MRP), member 2